MLTQFGSKFPMVEGWRSFLKWNFDRYSRKTWLRGPHGTKTALWSQCETVITHKDDARSSVSKMNYLRSALEQNTGKTTVPINYHVPWQKKGRVCYSPGRIAFCRAYIFLVISQSPLNWSVLRFSWGNIKYNCC